MRAPSENRKVESFMYIMGGVLHMGEVLAEAAAIYVWQQNLAATPCIYRFPIVYFMSAFFYRISKGALSEKTSAHEDKC